jgi:hypothetical protein
MAYDDEELFSHQVTAWTVGQLRQAMDGLPDDLPVSVLAPRNLAANSQTSRS